MIRSLSLSRILKGLAVALGSFVALGTVAALWENSLFVRMIPAGDIEVVLLGLLSVLLETYVAIRRPFYSAKTAGVGGVLGFIGVAVPSATRSSCFCSAEISYSPTSSRCGYTWPV